MLTVITVTTIGMLSSAHRNIALKRIQENGMAWCHGLASACGAAPERACRTVLLRLNARKKQHPIHRLFVRAFFIESNLRPHERNAILVAVPVVRLFL